MFKTPNDVFRPLISSCEKEQKSMYLSKCALLSHLFCSPALAMIRFIGLLEKNLDFSDDAGLVENIGGIVKIIEGDKRAHKITTQEDLIYVAQMMGFES